MYFYKTKHVVVVDIDNERYCLDITVFCFPENMYIDIMYCKNNACKYKPAKWLLKHLLFVYTFRRKKPAMFILPSTPNEHTKVAPLIR